MGMTMYDELADLLEDAAQRVDVWTGYQQWKIRMSPLTEGWVPEAVERALPEYGVLVTPLLAALSSEGLIADNTIQNPMTVGTRVSDYPCWQRGSAPHPRGRRFWDRATLRVNVCAQVTNGIVFPRCAGPAYQ